MAALAKLISQVILLILPKLVDELLKYFREQRDLKRIKKENKKKGEDYENAPSNTAMDDFSRLP